MPHTTEVLTSEDAADLLRVSTKAILGFSNRGMRSERKVGRVWRFLRFDLVAYVHGNGGQDVAVFMTALGTTRRRAEGRSQRVGG